jgi:transcriptional antiterminator RfaH
MSSNKQGKEKKITPQPHLLPSNYFQKPSVSDEGGGSTGRQLPRWAVHTKPRAEKKLARHLERLEVAHYIPASLRRHVYGKRKPRGNWVPLFPSYVFILQDNVDRSALYRTDTVVQFIEVPDPVQLYRDLRNLYLTLVRKPAEVQQAVYQPGKPVEVRTGPLKGVSGELVEVKKGGSRLMLRVHFFDRAVSVDIDAGMVRAV